MLKNIFNFCGSPRCKSTSIYHVTKYLQSNWCLNICINHAKNNSIYVIYDKYRAKYIVCLSLVNDTIDTVNIGVFTLSKDRSGTNPHSQFQEKQSMQYNYISLYWICWLSLYQYIHLGNGIIHTCLHLLVYAPMLDIILKLLFDNLAWLYLLLVVILLNPWSLMLYQLIRHTHMNKMIILIIYDTSDMTGPEMGKNVVQSL